MEFKLINNRELANGTSLIGHLELIPSKVIETFGNPQTGDDYKVSGEYLFKQIKVPNDVITLYDWKWTTLYDEGNPYTPEEFWELNKPITLNVGGRKKEMFNSFKDWIKSELKN